MNGFSSNNHSNTPEGRHIIRYNAEKILVLEEESLKKLLLNDKVRDRYVCVVSIAGAFRQGKSLFLDLMLFYLEVKYGKHIDVSHWLDGKYGEVAGFHYQHGTKPDTKGILMYPEIYLTERKKDETVEKIAIILVDTQGAFDGHAEIKEFATIFGLSSFISSVQIYNLMRNIKQDDLLNLECFAGMCSLLKDFHQFQKLIFLVRDFGFAYEHDYGENQRYLEHVFSSTEISAETISIMTNLKKFFTSITAFLLPSPGAPVASKGTFKGQVKDLDKDFVCEVEKVIESVLSHENLIVKVVQGQKLTACQLFHCIKSYVDIFSSGDIPHIKGRLFSYERDRYVARLSECSIELFLDLMSFGKLYMTLEEANCKAVEIVKEHFKLSCSAISTEDSREYSSNFEKKLEELLYKCKDEYSKQQTPMQAFFRNWIDEQITKYEEGIQRQYDDEYNFFNEADLRTKMDELSKIYDAEFNKELVNYFEKCDRKCSDPKRSIEEKVAAMANKANWKRFLVIWTEKRKESEEAVLSLWKKKLQRIRDEIDCENNLRKQKATVKYEEQYSKVYEDSKRRYEQKMEEVADSMSFFELEQTFQQRLRQSDESVRKSIAEDCFDQAPIPKELEHIKSDCKSKHARACDEARKSCKRNGRKFFNRRDNVAVVSGTTVAGAAVVGTVAVVAAPALVVVGIGAAAGGAIGAAAGALYRWLR